MNISDDGNYVLEQIEHHKPFSGKCTFKKIEGDKRLDSVRVTFNADFSLFMTNHMATLERHNEEMAAKISGHVAQEIRQCADWTSEIQERDELLRIFIKHMTLASQTWFPKPMIEAKKRAEKLLGE